MTSSGGWEIDHRRLSEAVDAWQRADAPPPDLIRAFARYVEECLAIDPERCGEPEGAREPVALYFGRVPGTNVGVLYVIDRPRRTVAVAVIRGIVS